MHLVSALTLWFIEFKCFMALKFLHQNICIKFSQRAMLYKWSSSHYNSEATFINMNVYIYSFLLFRVYWVDERKHICNHIKFHSIDRKIRRIQCPISCVWMSWCKNYNSISMPSYESLTRSKRIDCAITMAICFCCPPFCLNRNLELKATAVHTSRLQSKLTDIMFLK